MPSLRMPRAVTIPRRAAFFLLGLLVSTTLVGCATIQELTALRDVDFSLEGTSESSLAGVSIESIRSYEDLGVMDAARLAEALSRGELPFRTTLQVRASNPPDNVRARLVELDWTLFLDDRETVSGVLDREFVLPPGEPVSVPVAVELDLLDFFDRQLEQVVNLALAVAGAGEPQRVRLEARPTVQTRLGPISYPQPIRIEHEVGG